MHILIHTVLGTLYMHSSICTKSNAHTNTHSFGYSTHLLCVCTLVYVLNLIHILLHTVILYMHSSICTKSNAHTNTHSYSVSERERERERDRERERERESTHTYSIYALHYMYYSCTFLNMFICFLTQFLNYELDVKFNTMQRSDFFFFVPYGTRGCPMTASPACLQTQSAKT